MASVISRVPSGVIVAGKYRIFRKIGCGSFGDVYLATNIKTGEVNIYYFNNNRYFKLIFFFIFKCQVEVG